ncbi:MAG: divergent PAP2 family protein [bacterium]|nr:divergent PAP2 family protein [bacterium]MDY4099383.1 divergent PAP2 family protein [Lachnospiraceae bacterium]
MTPQTIFLQIIGNQVLMGGIAGWFAAQFCKTLLDAILNHRLDISRFWGDGGMPSAHSSTVSCVAVSAGIVFGVGSFPFAICVILAMITMRDAMGVRLETGKQAKLLNEMVRLFSKDNPELPEERLKEFVGHTPAQVLIGCLTGCIMAFVLNLLYV